MANKSVSKPLATLVHIADEYIEVDEQIRALTERKAALRECILAHNAERLVCGRGEINRVETVRWTLDQKAVKAAMGDDWVTAHSRCAHVVSLRVTPKQEAAA